MKTLARIWWIVLIVLVVLSGCGSAGVSPTKTVPPTPTVRPSRPAQHPTRPGAKPRPSRPAQRPTLPPKRPTPSPEPKATKSVVSSKPGGRIVTYVPSEGIGNIAVRITFPTAPRYPDGAGVVVDVAPFFTRVDDFYEDLDAAPVGLIRVAYLWPGKSSASTGARSDGKFDYGGEISIRALRDVIRFAAGQIPDRDGHTIADLSPFPVLTDQVGLYAFSHPGIAAMNVLARYGDRLPVRYFVGRENPTVDAISAMELGYWDEQHHPVVNPLYRYPRDYSPDAISLDYSSVRWDPDRQYSQNPAYKGYPYFDLNGNGRYDGSDFILSYKVPTMFGKRVYSAALTKALRENGLTADQWPGDLATPEEAAKWWKTRVTPPLYPVLATKTPDLKALLLFAVDGHVQPLPDDPGIHQAYDGLRKTAGLWVRLNPDAAYMQPEKFRGYHDHPANTEPEDWAQARNWGYKGVSALAAQAAVAEMADRTHENDWSPDLNEALFPLTVEPRQSHVATPAPTQAASGPGGSAAGAPLYVFYAIHVQVKSEYAPYTDASMQRLDPRKAQGIATVLDSIAKVAEKHGMPITWEFPYQMARGLCASPRQPNPLQSLSSAGHEIAAYAHTDTVASAYRTLADCGFQPVTVGGLLFDAARASDPQASFSQQIRSAAESGFRYVTANLAPSEDARRNPFGTLCHNRLGEGNDMWAQTGNLLFPWRPDYAHDDICTAVPSGKMLLIDHVGAEWMAGTNGRNVPALTAENFARLQRQLDAAVAYMDAHHPNRPAAWGFVSHITEYTLQDDGTGRPDQKALEALDDFLAHLESLQKAGKIRMATVKEVGKAAEETAAAPPSTPVTESGRGYITFVVNVHDWGEPDRSAATLQRLLSIFEKYHVRGDFYFTGPVVHALREKHPEVIESLRNSDMTISYHVRAPHPLVRAFGDSLRSMDGDTLYRTLMDYETYRLDLSTGGLDRSQPGGYTYVAQTFGRKPVVVSFSNKGHKQIAITAWKIYASLGARMTLVYHTSETKMDRPFEYVHGGLLIRPSDFGVASVDESKGTHPFWWEAITDADADPSLPLHLLQTQLDSWEAKNPPRQPFIVSLIHENDFYQTGPISWSPIYYRLDADGNALGRREPPFDLSIPSQAKMLSEQEREKIWRAYEELVAYAARNLRVVTSEDIVEMAK